MPPRAISREDFVQLASDNIAAYLQGICSSFPILTKVVADGPSAFRNMFARDLRGWPVDDDMANKAFRFLETQFLINQHGLLHRTDLTPAHVLDSIEQVTPPTKDEIAKAWTVESASSEEGKRALYGPDGNPKTLLDQLKRMHEDDPDD